MAENFFKALKTEMIYQRKFKTRAQSKLEIFDYIKIWYNRKRRHSTLNYLTPVQLETEMIKNEKKLPKISLILYCNSTFKLNFKIRDRNTGAR